VLVLQQVHHLLLLLMMMPQQRGLLVLTGAGPWTGPWGVAEAACVEGLWGPLLLLLLLLAGLPLLQRCPRHHLPTLHQQMQA
jgi:hypothetical protein